jgi:hemerythrin-like domain-containing protein
MCEYCGCRGVEPIAELMDEHTALVELADLVREDLRSADPASAMTRLAGLVSHLNRHVQREEAGIFQALRDEGEFLDEVDGLEDEHRGFETAIAELGPGSPDFAARVTHLLKDLDAHVERENLGIFPVSVVTLGATGWATIEGAHQRSPSFLLDPAAAGVPDDPTGAP